MYDERYRYHIEEEYEDELRRIPSVDDLYSVILKLIEEDDILTLEELRKLLKDYFWLTEEDCKYGKNSRNVSLFYRRVYAAVYYLFNHYLLKRVTRGTYTLTRWGYQVVECYPNVDEGTIELLPVRPHFVSEEEDWQHREFYPNVGIGYFGLNDTPEIEPVETWYGLTEEEFEYLYETDVRFRNLINTGHFVYHEGRVVPVRYYWDEGDYSRLCFKYFEDSKFQVEIKKNFRTKELYFECLTYDYQPINRSFYLYICKRPFDWDNPYYEEPIERLIRTLPFTTSEIFKFLKEELGVNWQKLARVLGISERILRYWKNPSEEDSSPEIKIKLDKLIAICLALNLPPEISDLIIKRVDAVDKNGFKFDPDAVGGEQLVWNLLISRHYLKMPQEINAICQKNHIDPLFSVNEDDYKDDTKVDHGIERKKKN